MALEGPAQTFNYMLLGYGVILGCIAVLLASMVARYQLAGALTRACWMSWRRRASGRAAIGWRGQWASSNWQIAAGNSLLALGLQGRRKYPVAKMRGRTSCAPVCYSAGAGLGRRQRRPARQPAPDQCRANWDRKMLDDLPERVEGRTPKAGIADS